MRYFFAPMPATGHVNPGLALAQALVKRGHDVRWYSTPRFKKAIEAVGARYVPFDRDCEEELRREPADVIVGDNGSTVAEAVHTKLGIAWAVYGSTNPERGHPRTVSTR
jgi:Glycosyltransferase family 28 N-terminal domain